MWDFQVSTSSDAGFRGIFELENGVIVELPPERGDVLPMDCDTSQNLTRWSSPEVIHCEAYSVDELNETRPPWLSSFFGGDEYGESLALLAE